MEVTEIRVFLKEGQDKKLKSYATVTFDHVFVVRNIKVIQGAGGLFIAMPSRKLKALCPKCGFKNEVGSKFCNQCGVALPEHISDENVMRDAKAEHRDIAHPVTQQFRSYLQSAILEAYEKEVRKGPSASRASEDGHSEHD
jgi:stage V sporulation protein G